jgi:short-subunit dehydrogenase
MEFEKDFETRYGPWALVTGASSGIGEAFAHLLAEAGIHLLIVARRGDTLNALAKELSGKHGVEVEALSLDLGQPDFLDSLLEACDGKDIGLVVSNAGIAAKGAYVEMKPQELTRLLDVNCRAPLLLAQAFLPRLKQRGRGGFLITGSLEGFQAYPYSVPYAATKAFVHSLGEGLWGEMRGSGIDVLVLAPGATDTELLPLTGMDVSDMPTGVMSSREVALVGLKQLQSGPTVIAGFVNRLMMGMLGLMPRRWAILAGGKGMQDAMKKSQARQELEAKGSRD